MTQKGKQGKQNKSHKTVKEYLADMPRLWTSAVAKPSIGVKFKPIWLGVLSGSASAIVKRFNPNSIYQPEVGGPAGSTPGYVDWAAFYGFYRVVGYKYRVTFTNKESFPVAVWVSNSNNDPGTSTNSSITSNPLTQFREISSKGGQDRVTLEGSFSLVTVVGTTSIYTSDSYRSLIGQNPADVTWLGMGAQSINGNITVGVDVELQLSQKTVMYDYLLQTPAPIIAQIQQHQLDCAQKRLTQTRSPPQTIHIVQGEEKKGCTIPNTL